MLTIAQLLTPITAANFRSQAVAGLQSLGLQPQNWAAGGIASSTLTVACNLLATLSTQLSNAIAQQWNPTATGGGLQLLSYYFYGITPPQATFAAGSLTLTNTGGGVYTYAAGQATFASTVANSQGIYPTYTNTNSFTLGALATLSVPVTCVFAGSGGNSSPGFVTQLVTAMLGVTCTNPLPILGSDALSDTALRQLNVNSLAIQSVYGPRNAYAYAIQTAVNFVTGSPVNINRWTISVASHTGDITIYVCGPAGTTDSNDQIGVALNIEAIARPDGITVGPTTVTVAGLVIGSPAPATPVNYNPTITVYVLAPKGVAASILQTTIVSSLTVWFEGATNPIGGATGADDANPSFTGILESGVSGQIAIAVASITGCVMLSTRFVGTSDLPLTANEVAVYAVPSLTVNVQYSS